MVVGSEGRSSRSLLFAMLSILKPLLPPVNFCDEAVIGPCPRARCWCLPYLLLVLRPFRVVRQRVSQTNFRWHGGLDSTSDVCTTDTVTPGTVAAPSRDVPSPATAARCITPYWTGPRAG